MANHLLIFGIWHPLPDWHPLGAGLAPKREAPSLCKATKPPRPGSEDLRGNVTSLVHLAQHRLFQPARAHFLPFLSFFQE